MSSLETSVTLEDVFTVVEGKRVPLAPELAGYLALEIADGTDAGGGDVDPKTVFISEEGTVALVRPKRDSFAGDAEASVRSLLAKLLEASGSGTPALTTAAKRKPGNGLPALVEELEAALIPVNRAAGRRALARLAREVKRVTLGVGRNASSAPKAPSMSVAPHARPVLRKKESTDQMKAVVESSRSSSRVKPFTEEQGTTRRANELALQMNEVDSSKPAPSPRPSAPLPPPPAAKSSVVPPPPPPMRQVSNPNIDLPVVPPAPEFPAHRAPDLLGVDEVDSLLDAFNVSGTSGDKQISRDLKAMAGLDPTPPPPDARTLAELTKDVGKDLPRSREPSIDGDSIEALLALADASVPVKSAPAPAPVRPKKVTPPPPIAEPISERVPASAHVPDPRAPAKSSRVAKASLPTKSDPPPKASTPPPSSRAPVKKSTSRDRPRAPRTGMALMVIALVVVIGGTAAIWKFAPQIFTGRRHLPQPTATVATSAAPPATKCKVALVLSDVPNNAEILLRMGQAPVDVERMPVGTRLEFVATAEGNAPRRAVIKAEAAWDKGPDGKPRIEIPLQLDPSKAKAGAVDPWPPAEPGSQVGGSGAPGTVHVISNVRGAEVWLLAGLGPEARIEQLRCDADIDVLLAGPTTFRKRLHIAENDISATTMDAQGNRVVTLSAKN